MTNVYIKRGVVPLSMGVMYRQTNATIDRLNLELGLLADIADMQGKATQTKRDLINQANAIFIH